MKYWKYLKNKLNTILNIYKTNLSVSSPGGRIDHAHHFNNPFRALEETLVLESTLLSILSVINLQETLIVLTSDHSHVLTLGGLTTPKGNNILGKYYKNYLFFSTNLLTEA